MTIIICLGISIFYCYHNMISSATIVNSRTINNNNNNNNNDIHAHYFVIIQKKIMYQKSYDCPE